MQILAVALIIVLVFALWKQPVFREYTVVSEKVENSIRIIQLSDLHGTYYGENQVKLLAMIHEKKPDIIVMTGDMIDDRFPSEGSYVLMDELASYPMYFVSGNHEHRNVDFAGIMEKVKAKGIRILHNETVEVKINGESILLSGIMDPSKGGKAISDSSGKSVSDTSSIRGNLEETKMKKLNTKDCYTVLLSHRPEHAQVYKEYPQDLVLTGHAHGGQVRIPFLINGLYAPNQGKLPKHAGGLYEFDTYKLIVSRGLAVVKYLPRVFNPPEVVVIDIIGGKE